MSQQPPQPRMCVFKVNNYCHCRGCNERIQEFYNHIAKKYGLPKQKINEDELKDGIVKVRGTANESEVWKVLKEHTKKKKVFLVKGQNGSSNTSTTTEAQLGNQLKNLSTDISNNGSKEDNESEKNGDKGHPKANHHDQQKQQQRDANSRRKGSRGFTSGSIYEIGESSQMGERRGEPSQTSQTSRYPMGHIEAAQNNRMDSIDQYRMNHHPINRGESQWECYFSEDNANSCTIM